MGSQDEPGVVLVVDLAQGQPQPSLRVLWLLLEFLAFKTPGAGGSSFTPTGPTHKLLSRLLAMALVSPLRRQWLLRGPGPRATSTWLLDSPSHCKFNTKRRLLPLAELTSTTHHPSDTLMPRVSPSFLGIAEH